MISIANLKSIGIVLILLIILFGIILFGRSQTETPSPAQTPLQSIKPALKPDLAPPSISPSASIDATFNTYSEQYLKEQAEVNSQEQGITAQAAVVSKFVDRLPITGNYIKVTYNIYNNQVYLEYLRNNKEAALAEFVKLLKKNQIENVSWLYNLNIVER